MKAKLEKVIKLLEEIVKKCDLDQNTNDKDKRSKLRNISMKTYANISDFKVMLKSLD